MKKQIIPQKEQENVLGVLWFLLQDAEGKCSQDPVMKLHISQTYDLLNRIKFTENRPRWEEKDIKPAPKINAEIYPQGGIDCKENCQFSSECANHTTAGEFRSDDGFTPELSINQDTITCQTKHRNIMEDINVNRILPENYPTLGRGSLIKNKKNKLVHSLPF
jgi:hypothetical protein